MALPGVCILSYIAWMAYEVEVTDEWLEWFDGLTMGELRVQAKGRPFRTFYAFDPRRVAILLIGGDKTGNDRWYEEFVPRADDLYDEHLEILRKEGLI